MSRELHDGLGSELSNIIHNLDFIGQLNKKGRFEDLSLNIEELQNYTRTTLHHLRGGIWVLHHQSIQFQQLVSQIQSFALNQLGYSHSIDFEINLDETLSQKVLSSEYALTLFRVSQEVINNAIKYSKASKIGIEITVNKSGKIDYIIYDNGIGMVLEEVLNKDSYGLKNIYVRIRELNEEIEIISKPNEGTNTHITLLNL
jgi:signal transduction histidine kinase